MKIIATINTADVPRGRSTIDVYVEADRVGHQIQVNTDTPLCEVKGFVFDTVNRLIDDAIGRSPKRGLVDEIASYRYVPPPSPAGEVARDR